MSLEAEFKGHRGARFPTDVPSALAYANAHAKEIGIALVAFTLLFVFVLQPSPPPIYVDEDTGQILARGATLPAHSSSVNAQLQADLASAPKLASKVDALVAENKHLMTQLRQLSAELRRLPDTAARVQSSGVLASSGAAASINALSAPGEVNYAKATPSPLKDQYSWVGRRMGLFEWEKFRFERNSSARLFWIKTANNEEGHHLYRRLLITNGWMETKEPNTPNCIMQFYGRFVPPPSEGFPVFKEGVHMVNHIPGEYGFFNKEPWLHYVRNYSRDHGCDYTKIHPETFRLHNVDECYALMRFTTDRTVLTAKRQTFKQREQSFWFWKPPGGSFGRGVRVGTLAEMRDAYGFNQSLLEALPADVTKEQIESAVKQRCVVLGDQLKAAKGAMLIQRAVHPPMLIKGSKFDFRAYLLIANTKPYSVYYRFGHVRRCMRPYNVTTDEKKVHVCNDYSDELENPNFPINEHIWPYERFEEYLIKESGFTPEQVHDGFVTNMKRLFLGVFRSVQNHISRKNGYWLLCGVDIAVDAEWGLHVLEVNTNPSLHYGTEVWGRGIVERNYRIAAETLELVLDAHYKAPPFRTEPVLESELVMRTLYGYELIYSDQVSPPYAASQDACYDPVPVTIKQSS